LYRVSDHAPHAYDEKEAAFDDAPFASWTGDAFAVAHTELVQGGVLTLPRAGGADEHAAGAVFRAGRGHAATAAPWPTCASSIRAAVDRRSGAVFHQVPQHGPFAGRELVGRPTLTLVAGKIVHDGAM